MVRTNCLFKKFYPVCRDRELFIILFFSFFVIHGEYIFNKISFWDDIISSFGSRFFMNEPLPHGRWLNFIIEQFMRLFSGTESLPVFNGIIVAACIATFSLILFSMYNIDNNCYKLALGLILLSIPTVAGNLAYGYWAGKDFIGRLICIVAAYVTCKDIHIQRVEASLRFFGGSLLFALSLGEYQCYFALYLSLCLLFLMNLVMHHNLSFKDFIGLVFRYILNIAVGVTIYLIVLHLFLHLEGVKLLHYANTDTYGIVSLQGYIDRIKLSYMTFFDPYILPAANMFPFHWHGWYKMLIMLNTILVALFMYFAINKRQKAKLYQFCFLLFLMPCALNSNIILYGGQFLHSLHVYQQALLFLLPYIIYKAIISLNENNSAKMFSSLRLFSYVIVLFTVAFAFLYIRYDNYCYMLSEFRQTQAIRYYTTLSTRIMSIKGYKHEYPVVFMGEMFKMNSVDKISEFNDFPVTNPFYLPIINSYVDSSRAFMKYWCGYEPRFLDAKDFENNSVVKLMPCYPDDGAIKVIDGVVIVKFR